MIKSIPNIIIRIMGAINEEEANCVEVFCGENDCDDVIKYLREKTDEAGNETIKKYFLNLGMDSTENYINSLYHFNIDKEKIMDMIGDARLEDSTLSFDIWDILGVEYSKTPKGIFITMHDGNFYNNNRPWGKAGSSLELALDTLKDKFPGINYVGCYCYLLSDESGDEGKFNYFGNRRLKSAAINEYLLSKLKAVSFNLDDFDFDQLGSDFEDQEEETVSFLIDNNLYEQVEDFISLLIENVDCCEDYLSSEKFDEAINTLYEKKKISQDLLEKLLDSDVISDSLRDLLEEYSENDTDDDDEDDYDDDDYDDDE